LGCGSGRSITDSLPGSSQINTFIVVSFAVQSE
jgi:hypothetical protein